MKWSEGMIAAAIARQTLARRCVVLVDRCTWTGHECDVLGVTTDLRIIDVEIKISRADLKSDARKDKWWSRPPSSSWLQDGRWVRPEGIARLHPPRVWKHYYAMPAEIWTPDLVECLPSPASGVILFRERTRPHRFEGEDPLLVSVERRAKPCSDATRLTPEQVMNIARLANLRMWDAYQRAQSAERALRESRAEAAA